ncbi:uncharacterized protein LOC135434855 [Drosophila montana]|uniref:uncharacterized protein LOC135434855 n=1 Tax=Drosophila montana TaxID=40370 RepID=UPI00313A7F76
MYNKSASAPELYVRSAETQTDPRKHRNTKIDIPVEENAISYEPSLNTQYLPQPESRHERNPGRIIRMFTYRPSRLAFLSYVYVLLVVQVALSTMQWLLSTYRWRPQLNGPERNFNMLLLLLTWVNLTLAFLGFRRLQLMYPLNWIIFLCMFESLTLLIMFLCVRELDLTWYIIVIGLAVLLIYTPLGLWRPAYLTTNLWILIFLSVTVFVTSTLALLTGLAMHLYLPLTFCVTLFGPWTMYNTFRLHKISRDIYSRFGYLEQAAKMYIAFGCTVGGLVVVSRIASDSIESESCRGVAFCHMRSVSITYGPGN